MNKTDIKSLNFDRLKEEIISFGDKAFRGKQIYDWIHVKLVDSFDEMTNIYSDNPLNTDEAIKELKKLSGKRFDPNIVDLFVKMIYKNRH